ncbi:hypothetical protein H0H93_008751, partial [Arthromyces matolae]
LVALPFDITSEILQHCDCRTLASMAQIDKIHQSTAEHLLYESLVFVTEDFESGCLLKCLKTLSIIPQKAARVRLFDIDLSDHYIDLDDTFYDDVFFPSLGTALIAMSNVDTLILRIDDFCRKHSGVPPQDRFFPIFELANLLGPALRKCTFSPTTMIVPPALHPATWAQKHDNLRSLQLHEMVSWLPPINESFIQTYRQWTLDSAYTLTISALVRSETPNFVVAFPIFQPNWSAKPIQALVRKPLLEFKRELKAIHLVISSVGTEQMIGNLNSVAECFPHIQTLRLLVEDGEIYDVRFLILFRYFPFSTIQQGIGLISSGAIRPGELDLSGDFCQLENTVSR